ncbi:hypothetical protein E0H75_14235 [Kribbella capetownensis]|uniref:Uncharacterized protein n=1 Tax=Kribbella capetownensis TaxID=1572659 RepID=A0A4R0K0P6_9ACTN|nr:hypothetical protein [Kribbella capetownensis]TCC51276.1 hypothetical protein E0H75_14235 [Kribbella capetownensis]
MPEPSDPIERVDQALSTFLPHIGAVAVDSARIEWGLSQLVSMLTNTPLADTLRMKTDQQVREIKRSLRDAAEPDHQPWADAITDWATTAKDLLRKRGDLMHSRWIIGDVPSPDDLVRTGQLTPEQAQRIDPQDYVNVYSSRLRGSDLPKKRSAPDLAEFAQSLHQHMSGYRRMWLAAGIVLGLWPAPTEPAARSGEQTDAPTG